MNKILYHYTEYIAFDGIINSGIIRLNNILNMNDAQEMRFFIDAIKRAVVKMLKSDGNNSACERLSSFIENELKEEFHYAAYAACFSGYRDDASQWDRYGNSGHGVCIGFDKGLLKSLMGGSVSLQKVYYGANVDEHPIVKDLYEISSRNIYDIERLQDVMDRIWTKSAAYKHPSFSSENEVRLVVSPFISDEFAVSPEYNVAKNRIKKYYPLNIKGMCERSGHSMNDLIQEIIIGPTSTQSKAILEDYLRDRGMGEIAGKIVLSECPLRSAGL